MKHYGNHPDRPVIEKGDLATFRGVRANTKVKVTDVNPPPEHHLEDTGRTVTVTVTERNNPAYPQGYTVKVSNLWLDPRDRS